MRLFAVLAGIVFSLALVVGCGVSGRPQTLAWLGRGQERVPSSDPAADNPFRRRLAERQPERADNPIESAGDAMPPAGSGPSPATAALDPATQALVDRELQDATPEERRQLLTEFENIDPAMVRQLLRIRRMVRQIGHHAPSGQAAARTTPEAMTATDTVASSGAAASVGYSRGGPHVRFAHVGEDLGEATPWNTVQAADQPAPGEFQRASEQAFDPRSSAEPLNPAPAVPAIPSASAGRLSPATQPRVQLLAAETGPPPSRSPTSALARMVPRLDGFANLFPGTDAAESAGATVPAAEAMRTLPPGGAASLSGLSPADASPARAWQRDLESLIARLEADLAQVQPPAEMHDAATDDYIESQVYLRMLYLMAGRQEQAIAHIPDVAPALQQFWQQMFWSMANCFDVENMPDPAERATQTLLQLQAAAAHLHDQARLKLGNVAFCTKITSFGNYDRFDPYEFSPGQPVLLYAEVENFRSEPTTDQQGQNAYRTILQSKIEVLSPSGEIRYQMEFPPTEDLCRARRRDYFHSYEFTIPPRLPYGHHVLLLTVEDRLSQKLATYRLNFTVR